MEQTNILETKKSRLYQIISYLMIILILFFPPLSIQNSNVHIVSDLKEIIHVLPNVFSNAMFKGLPTLSLILKFTNATFLFSFLIIKKLRKYFNIYVFSYMLFIALTQNIAPVAEIGTIISTGSLTLMLLNCFIWLFGIRKTEQDCTLNKKYLWMLGIIFICLWYPLDAEANFNFSIDPSIHFLSSSMYCFNMPVFISLLLLFFKRNSSLLYEIIAIIGLLFSVATILVNLNYSAGIPNAIMHLPLFISTLTLLIHSLCNRKENVKGEIK